MATHDYVLDNATGANFRSDLNNALAAIVSNNSSSSEPSTKYAYQWWADTNAAVLKLRNSANDGWVTLFKLDGTITLADGSTSAPSLAFDDDSNTGIFSSAADTLDITCGGTTRGSFSSSGLTVTGGIDGTGGNIVLGDSGSASDDRIKIGASGDLEIYHDGTNSILDNATGEFRILGDIVRIMNGAGTKVAIETNVDNNVELYFNNGKKAETVTGGFTVTGTCTATAFAGDGSALTGVGGGTTINSNGSQRLITGSDTSGTLEGQVNLTFDGNSLVLANSTGNIKAERHGGGANFTLHGSADSGNTAPGSSDDIGNIVWQTADGTDRNNVVAYMTARTAGSFSNSSHPTQLEFYTTADSTTSTVKRLIITKSGHLIPAASNTYDLGDTSTTWRNIYTNDLHLSNKGHKNDVDGTWGSYTIQEGEEDLFLLNKRNNKKYKFNLTEVK